MIGYVTLGTNDLPRAAAFYDALFEAVGGKRHWDSERFVAWAVDPKQPGLGVIKPFDGKPASVGNGTMVALALRSSDQVDAMYNKAMELGATDEGKPGPRVSGFYAGYFRDLDGNKLNFFCFQRQPT